MSFIVQLTSNVGQLKNAYAAELTNFTYERFCWLDDGGDDTKWRWFPVDIYAKPADFLDVIAAC